jgi:hypothetical protein
MLRDDEDGKGKGETEQKYQQDSRPEMDESPSNDHLTYPTEVVSEGDEASESPLKVSLQQKFSTVRAYFVNGINGDVDQFLPESTPPLRPAEKQNIVNWLNHSIVTSLVFGLAPVSFARKDPLVATDQSVNSSAKFVSSDTGASVTSHASVPSTVAHKGDKSELEPRSTETVAIAKPMAVIAGADPADSTEELSLECQQAGLGGDIPPDPSFAQGMVHAMRPLALKVARMAARGPRSTTPTPTPSVPGGSRSPQEGKLERDSKAPASQTTTQVGRDGLAPGIGGADDGVPALNLTSPTTPPPPQQGQSQADLWTPAASERPNNNNNLEAGERQPTILSPLTNASAVRVRGEDETDENSPSSPGTSRMVTPANSFGGNGLANLRSPTGSALLAPTLGSGSAIGLDSLYNTSPYRAPTIILMHQWDSLVKSTFLNSSGGMNKNNSKARAPAPPTGTVGLAEGVAQTASALLEIDIGASVDDRGNVSCVVLRRRLDDPVFFASCWREILNLNIAQLGAPSQYDTEAIVAPQVPTSLCLQVFARCQPVPPPSAPGRGSSLVSSRSNTPRKAQSNLAAGGGWSVTPTSSGKYVSSECITSPSQTADSSQPAQALPNLVAPTEVSEAP